MRLSATELRSQLYSVLDRVEQTGESVEIVRKGVTFRISLERPEPVRFSAARLVSHPGTIVGDPDDLVQIDWSKEWKPFGTES